MPPRTRTTVIPSLISISLVLFFLGLFAMIAVGGKLIVDKAKENLVLKAMLAEGTTNEQALRILRQLQNQPYVKQLGYLSRQDALKLQTKDLGDDFVKAMDGMNPFLSSINVRLNAEYIHSDSIRVITQQIMQNAEVQEVDYPIKLIEKVNDRIDLWMQISLAIGLVLLAVAFFLILNTVKLAIFSKRLMIRTMQLIGATNGFIRAPFIRIGILQGFFGGLIANALLLGLLFGLRYQLDVEEFQYAIDDLLTGRGMLVLYLSLIVLGVLLGWFSSNTAVNRFLNKNLDQII
jgi:cell division transport system permease protein